MIVKITDNKWVDITIKNARELSLKSNIENINITSKNSKIIKLEFLDSYTVDLTKPIIVDFKGVKCKYIITNITQDGVDYTLSCISKPNISSEIILPLVASEKQVSTNYFFNSYFYNSYLYCNEFPSMSNGNYLFLKYRFFSSENFDMFEEFITVQKNYVKTIYSLKEFIIYVFEIPTKYKDDISKVLLGKYSEIDKQSKNKICYFHNNHPNIKTLKQELYKEETLRRTLSDEFGWDIPKDFELKSKISNYNETCII